jgi:integration host factor subunit alpha
MALTKAKISNHLSEKIGLSKREAKEFLETFFEEIKVTLETGDEVKISGFGSFELKDKNERPGRNPKTGEDIPIAARRVVTFKAGQKLKDLVKENLPDIESKL